MFNLPQALNALEASNLILSCVLWPKIQLSRAVNAKLKCAATLEKSSKFYLWLNKRAMLS
jgi:hypothetical protein